MSAHMITHKGKFEKRLSHNKEFDLNRIELIWFDSIWIEGNIKNSSIRNLYIWVINMFVCDVRTFKVDILQTPNTLMQSYIVIQNCFHSQMNKQTMGESIESLTHTHTIDTLGWQLLTVECEENRKRRFIHSLDIKSALIISIAVC